MRVFIALGEKEESILGHAVLWSILFWGCFSPVLGSWGLYNTQLLGDCAIDSAQTLDEFMTISESSTGFSLSREEDVLSCSLTGKEFSCTAMERVVDMEEVELTLGILAQGEFFDSATGDISIEENWTCSAGACDTYGVSSCVKIVEGDMALSKAN